MQQRINLNQASRRELVAIPAIGDNLAQRIVAYRESHGGIGSIEELRQLGLRKPAMRSLMDHGQV